MPEERTLLEETEPKDIKKLVKGLEGDFGFVVASVGGMACKWLIVANCHWTFQLSTCI